MVSVGLVNILELNRKDIKLKGYIQQYYVYRNKIKSCLKI